MEFNKIKKVKLHTEVARIIEDYIDGNNLRRRDKLPSERELAEKLGIGRSSLREALRVLESQGVVEVISGKGIYVGDKKPETFEEGILSDALRKKVTLLELYQIRRPLGVLSIELAARNIGDDQIEELASAIEAYEDAYRQGNSGREEDRRFHMLIHRFSGNRLLYSLFDFIFKLWDDFHFSEETAFPDSVPLHRPLYEAIVGRDPKRAVRAYHRLMDYVEQRIMELVEQYS